MLAKSACGHRAYQCSLERVLARVEQLPAIQLQAVAHLIFANIGLLEIEPHAIGKADEAQAQPLVYSVGHDLASRPEITIGKFGRLAEIGCRDGGSHCGSPSAAQTVRAARGSRSPFKADQWFDERGRIAFDCRQCAFRSDLVCIGFEPLKRGLRGGGHAVICDQTQRTTDQCAMGSGIRTARARLD